MLRQIWIVSVLNFKSLTSRFWQSMVIVVGLAEKRVGIVVDDLLGQQDIVIKPLGDTLKGIKGIIGAADLGDRRTILVLDVGGIISEATRSGA